MIYLSCQLPLQKSHCILTQHLKKKKKQKKVFLAVLFHVINQFNLHDFQEELPAGAVVAVVVTGYKQGGLMSLKMPNPL